MDELYQLPNGWEYVKLANIVGKEKIAIKRGPFGSALKKAFFVPDGYKVYEQKHAIRDDFTIGEYYIDEEKFQELKGFEVKGGDIIISCSGTIGKIAVAPLDIKKGIINQALLKITLDNDVVETDFFVKFWTDYVNKGMSENSTKGAAIKNLASVKVLKDLDIPLPPIKEQKRILAKLDDVFAKLDKAIHLHQENIAEANAYMDSVLNEVFSELEEKYESVVLGDITKTTSGGTPKRNEKSYWGGNIGWLKSGELTGGYINTVEEFITETGLQKSSAKLFPVGTLLIAMYGATVGKLGILEIETTTNQAICGILNDKGKFETMYMFYFLKKTKSKMLEDSFGGAQPNISQTYLKELELPLPPLEEQKKVVEYLDDISSKMDKIKALQKEKLQELKALKASILDSAFRGEL